MPTVKTDLSVKCHQNQHNQHAPSLCTENWNSQSRLSAIVCTAVCVFSEIIRITKINVFTIWGLTRKISSGGASLHGLYVSDCISLPSKFSVSKVTTYSCQVLCSCSAYSISGSLFIHILSCFVQLLVYPLKVSWVSTVLNWVWLTVSYNHDVTATWFSDWLKALTFMYMPLLSYKSGHKFSSLIHHSYHQVVVSPSTMYRL